MDRDKLVMGNPGFDEHKAEQMLRPGGTSPFGIERITPNPPEEGRFRNLRSPGQSL